MTIEDRPTLIGLLEPRTVSLQPGEILLREGEVSGRMYLLQEGRLEVLRHGEVEGGELMKLGTVEPGHLVGEVSLLEGTPHSATLRASEPCTLLEVSRQLLDQFDPKSSSPLEYLLAEMARSVSRHLRRSTDDAVAGLRRELEADRLRHTMASFVIYLLMGLAAYAVLMQRLFAHQAQLSEAIVVTGPMLLGMALLPLSWARRNRVPMRMFGLTIERARTHVWQAMRWSVPVIMGLTLLKWALVLGWPEMMGSSVVSLLARPPGTMPWLSLAGYAVLAPLQEFIARGTIQAPLFVFFTGADRRRWWWAIIVSNTLFAATHLHLTLPYSVAAFVGGLLWGALYARQQSLVGPVVSHVLVGTWALYGLGFADLLKSMG